MSMKTLIDIDEKLIRRAQKISGAKSKKETVTYALQELLRSKKRLQLREMIGHYQHSMTLKELLQLRTRS